jgi:hypothetical protein
VASRFRESIAHVLIIVELKSNRVTEEELGSGITNVLAKVVPGGRLEVRDTGVDIMVDVFAIKQKVLTNVPGERSRRFESFDHVGHLLDVHGNVTAVGHCSLDFLDHVANFLETSFDMADILLFEVIDGSGGIRHKAFSILEALVNICEALSIEGTLQETFNDVNSLSDDLGVNLLYVLGGSTAK